MSWKKYKFGDFLTRSKIPIDIEDDKEYKRVTIKTKHQGVSVRDIELGNKIGTKKQFTLKAGQFVLSKIDARYGAFGIAPDEVDNAIITGNFWAYDVDFSIINIEWFNQFTNSQEFYNVCERASSGITHRKYLNENFFLNYGIELPDTTEQLAIIEQFKRNKEADILLSNELTHQLDLVKQLRQAFLREAMQGKLTAKWREDNPDVEPASELLKKIKAEKEQLIKEKKIKKQKPLPPISEDEIPFKIPESWEWCRIGSIVQSMTNGIYKQEKFYNINGIGCFRMYNITEGKINFGRLKRMSLTEEEIRRYKLTKNDLLLNRVNSIELLGKSALVPALKEPYVFESKNIRVILMNKDFTAPYVNYLFLTSFIKSQIYKSFKKVTGQASISQEKLNPILIPLPSKGEQQQIVTKLDNLMQYCDKLEESIKDSQQQNEMLLQQVLREALEPKK
jgi:type I restriction enzyme, S subunit